MEQDQRLVELDRQFVGVGDEIGREVAAIEAHALDQVEHRVETARLFDGDHAFLADLVHRIGNDFADRVVAVGRDSRDLLEALALLHRPRHFLDRGNRLDHRGVDSAPQLHRGETRGQQLDPLAQDCARQHRRGGGAVAGDIGGLLRDLSNQLRAHVLEAVFELDFLYDRHAVLGHGRCAEAPLNHDVAALGAERNARSLHHQRRALNNSHPRSFVQLNRFGRHLYISVWSSRYEFGPGKPPRRRPQGPS